MKTRLAIVSILFVGNALMAQADSVKRVEIQTAPVITNIIPAISDCVHSHVCCQVGCECCVELKRPQEYIEKRTSVAEGIERIMVAEKFAIAAIREKTPVYYQFEKKGKRFKKKFYNAAFSGFGNGNTGYGRELSAQELEKAETFDQEGKLVFDERYDFLFIDGQGNEQAMPFHSRVYLEQDLYRVSILLNKTRIYGLADEAGRKIGLLTYRSLQPFEEDGLAIVESWQRKYGVINKKGELLIPTMYNDIDRIGKGRFAVDTETGTVLMNEKGKQLNRRTYERIDVFSEGLAFAKRKRKQVYLDRTGREVLTLKWEWGRPFREGLAAVTSQKKWGYINRQGELVVDLQFDRARAFSGGAAPVAIGNNSNTQRWGLINREGRFITPLKYSDIHEIKDGVARTFVNGQGYGFVKVDGNELMESKYNINTYGNEQTYFVFDCLARKETRKDHSLELIGRTGNQLLNLSQYLVAHPVIVGKFDAHFIPFFLVYKTNTKRNLIDLEGKEMLKKDYQVISVLDESTAYCNRDDRDFLLDIASGKELFEITEGQFNRWEDGLVTVHLSNGVYRYFTRSGEEVIPFK